MSKTLGPVALKLGDEVLVRIRTDTAIKDLLEQLDKACKGGRIQDADGFDVTAHYSQDLPEGEYAIKQPTAGTSDEVLLALVEIKSLLQVHSVLQLDRSMYTEGKVTPKTDPGAQLFSRSIKAQYGALQGSKCWCLLTNAILPSSTVIGSHLFKLEWSEYVHLLGFENINDVKNGLPLWKPLEWGFDTSRLCFTFDKYSEKFIAKIMDPSILTKRLLDIGQEKMGSDWKSPPYPLQKLTFQDIDNRPLEFDPGRPLRLYKRVLNFQARQARTYAIRHGWQPASWDFEDYLTEGMDLSDKLKIWYNSMH